MDVVDRWAWLVLVSHTQLRLTRPLAENLRRLWPHPAPRTSHRLPPARVRRGFLRIHRSMAPGRYAEAVPVRGCQPARETSTGHHITTRENATEFMHRKRKETIRRVKSQAPVSHLEPVIGDIDEWIQNHCSSNALQRNDGRRAVDRIRFSIVQVGTIIIAKAHPCTLLHPSSSMALMEQISTEMNGLIAPCTVR